MLELAGGSVVDWVQEVVTKALSELRVSKHKTGQYARSIIISVYQKWTHRIGYIKKFITKLIHETLSTLQWRVKINVTYSVFYETESD